jgi:hypothetical protein
MPYVRSKTLKGRQYYYLVHGQRVDGKVKQSVIAYLGEHQTVGDAYLHWMRESRKPEKKQEASRMLKLLEPYI